MAKCDICGNEYDEAFRIAQGGRTMIFDRFECAIEALAPSCAHHCKIVGHGAEVGGRNISLSQLRRAQGSVRHRA
jgi:hypothetical protein